MVPSVCQVVRGAAVSAVAARFSEPKAVVSEAVARRATTEAVVANLRVPFLRRMEHPGFASGGGKAARTYTESPFRPVREPEWTMPDES
ncbi:hypothetical protein ACE1SV_05450 [Streptomyces sp. E-15]